MKITTQTAGDVLKALEDKAVDRFLDKTDFDVRDWLEGDDLKDYRQAYMIEFGGCPTCGGPVEECLTEVNGEGCYCKDCDYEGKREEFVPYGEDLVCEYESCQKRADRVVNASDDYDGDHSYFCSEHAEIVAKERGTTADTL